MFIKGSGTIGSHPKLHTYEEGYLLPVLTQEELLFSHRHKGLLRQFQDLAELPPEDFNRSYAALIKNFMEFVQVLPHKTSGILGSLLNYSLARASAVFQKYCQLRKGHTSPLLKFAVFSAALLKDVGRVLSNQRIVMVDETGEFHCDWNPFSGSMIEQTKYFKMYPISATYLRVESESTPMLARQLIPHDIFLWLSSDVAVFADWLAALLDEEGAGSKEITWALALIKREDIIAVLNSLDGAVVESSPTDVNEQGEAFLKWLKEGIEKGEISVNQTDSVVHVVTEGVLIEKKIFKQFCDLMKLPVNFLVVFNQVGNLMGIARKGGADFLHAAYFSPGESGAGVSTFAAGMANKSKTGPREGMVVDREMVFVNKTAPENSGLKSAKTMTSELHQKPSSVEAQSVASLKTKG